MPAEWARHTATQLYWPKDGISRVEETCCEIMEELHFFEPIHLFVENLATRNQVMQKLSGKAIDLDRIIIHQEEMSSKWSVEHFTTFVRDENQKIAVLDWGSDSSVEKPAGLTLAKYVEKKFGLTRIEPGIHLDANAIGTNGRGTVIASESILSATHQKVTKTEIEKILKTYAGANQAIWLKKMPFKNGNMSLQRNARWLNSDSILCASSNDPEDEYYEVLQENLESVKNASCPNGDRISVATLPLLKIKRIRPDLEDDEYVPVSYTDFYISNGAVLVPTYNHEFDRQAIALFKEHFPGRKVIPIDCTGLAEAGMSIRSLLHPWYGVLR